MTDDKFARAIAKPAEEIPHIPCQCKRCQPGFMASMAAGDDVIWKSFDHGRTWESQPVRAA